MGTENSAVSTAQNINVEISVFPQSNLESTSQRTNYKQLHKHQGSPIDLRGWKITMRSSCSASRGPGWPGCSLAIPLLRVFHLSLALGNKQPSGFIFHTLSPPPHTHTGSACPTECFMHGNEVQNILYCVFFHGV